MPAALFLTACLRWEHKAASDSPTDDAFRSHALQAPAQAFSSALSRSRGSPTTFV